MITNIIKAQYGGLPQKGIIVLQVGKSKPIEVSFFKKTTNTSKVDDFSNEKNGDTGTLIARKRQKYSGT
ncbi:hypothetical protein H5410_014469, partial [Solanum commersonii]